MTAQRRNSVLTAEAKAFIMEHGHKYTRRELAEMFDVSVQVVGNFVTNKKIHTISGKVGGYHAPMTPSGDNFGWLMPDIEEYFRMPHNRTETGQISINSI